MQKKKGRGAPLGNDNAAGGHSLFGKAKASYITAFNKASLHGAKNNAAIKKAYEGVPGKKIAKNVVKGALIGGLIMGPVGAAVGTAAGLRVSTAKRRR